jgi:hypothetical protein
VDVVAVFIDTIAKHLLTLLVDEVDVVEEHNLLLIGDKRARLTEYLDVVAVILDPLVL